MKPMARMLRWFLGLALACLVAGPAGAGCQVVRRGTVPVRLAAGAALVDVVINDTPLPMTLDTGAERTALTVSAVQRLRLAPDEWTANTLRGAGGRLESHRAVSPATMLLGGIPLRRRGLSPKPSLSVIAGIGPASPGPDRSDGLLGGDLLSFFDIDLDLPARQLTLFSVEGCAGRFLPWAGPYEAISIQLGMRSRTQPLVPVRLDGQPLLAVLDSGASASFVNLRGMRRLGLTTAMLANDPAMTAGVVGGMVSGRLHRFVALQVGPVVMREPSLLTVPVPTPIFDLLVGLDVWRTHRVWISYATSQIFVARPDE